MPKTKSNCPTVAAQVHVVVVRSTEPETRKDLRVRCVDRKDGYLLLEAIELEDSCSNTTPNAVSDLHNSVAAGRVADITS
jgi:hypothetical protein